MEVTVSYQRQIRNFSNKNTFENIVKPVYNGHPWDPQKGPLFRGGRYSEGTPIKLVWIWDVWGSGWPLLTGGRYSEVAVSTGLTLP